MRALRRNKQTIYFALFEGKEPITDDDGYRTGEYKAKYSNFTSITVNVSAGKGEAQNELFGTNLNYDKVIVTCDLECPIDENSILCVECEPNNDTHAFDYVVKKVLRSLNSVSIAISKVDVK